MNQWVQLSSICRLPINTKQTKPKLVTEFCHLEVICLSFALVKIKVGKLGDKSPNDMTKYFYNRFKNYNQEELFKIVFAPDDYQPEAVNAARQLITEKNLTNDFNKRLEEQNKKNIEEEELLQQEISEKAEYYKSVVEFKNDNNSFQVRIADIPKFEGALGAEGIDFFREDKNIGVQLDSYPTQTYFIRNEDAEKVDEIVKGLGLVTLPYSDIKPFFNFQIKVLLIVVALTILLVLLLK